MKRITGMRHAALAIICVVLLGCVGALQRGMSGNVYISTARPAISLSVRDMPLITAGRGMANMTWTSVMGGLPVQVWLAVYGQGALSPMAIVAQAQTPENWYWDGIMYHPFSVDNAVEIFDNTDYQACTYIINPANDPFGGLMTGTQADGQPQMWIARSYAARYNFNNDKIILQYREPLPPDVVSLTALPLGRDSFLREFADRARNAFIVAAPGADTGKIVESYPQGIQWQYMDQNFLGTVSRYDVLNFR